MNRKPERLINEQQVYRMIDTVRCETQLSYKLSSHTVYVVLENLLPIVPATAVSVIREILENLELPPTASEDILDLTQDMARLHEVTKRIQDMKNDAQQRSWELHDDQGIILEDLKEFKSILTDADVAIMERFLKIDDYNIVTCLAEYYQMESRWSIKMLLLEILDELCIRSRVTIKILLGTVLPVELTRDVRNSHEDRTKLTHNLNVMTKLFSIGEPLPVMYLDTINKNFIELLISIIESPEDDPYHDHLIIHIMNFILVYNLQFDSNKPLLENKTIQALKDAGNPKVFSETLLLLFNRGKDPVKSLTHEPYPQNSLLKLMTDIFSDDGVSNLFYENDVKVLIDIIIRQLMDDIPSLLEKHQWLKLIKQIIIKVSDILYKDRLRDIEACVVLISNDLSEEHCEERKFRDEILNHLSHLKML